MPNIEDKFSLFEQHIESKLTDIEIKIEQTNQNILTKLEDKVPFKLFIALLALMIGNLGSQWLIYEKTLQIEYNTKKVLVEFNFKIENTQNKINELREIIRKKHRF